MERLLFQLAWVVFPLMAQVPLQARAFPLFEAFPSLKERVPRVELLKEATPVYGMRSLQHRLFGDAGKEEPADARLWVKRDDGSDKPLGGNKARKLEFLLAQAREKGAKSLVTSGMYGSNHALATTIAGREAGFDVELILGPQPVTQNVREKLLSLHALGARMRFHGNIVGMGLDLAASYLRSLLPFEHLYYIPPGGSSIEGDLGYANAFLELVDQMGAGGLPEEIVLPVGTGGTSAGLLLGTCLAGVWERVRIVGVVVEKPQLTTERSVRRDAKRTWDYIRDRLSPEDQARLPKCDFKRSAKAFWWVDGYWRPEYGEAGPEVFAALKLLHETEALELDGTYSGKAMHYFLDTARARIAAGTVLPKTLFWHTYNSYSLKNFIDPFPWRNPLEKWRELPRRFWRLFQ